MGKKSKCGRNNAILITAMKNKPRLERSYGIRKIQRLSSLEPLTETSERSCTSLLTDGIYDGSESALTDTSLDSERSTYVTSTKLSPFAEFIFEGDDEDRKEDEQETIYWEGC